MLVQSEHQTGLIVQRGEVPLDFDLEGKVSADVTSVDMSIMTTESVPGLPPEISVGIGSHNDLALIQAPSCRLVHPAPLNHISHYEPHRLY
ncbi:hypothetical protein FQZ97_1054380 [compost metagenome]